MSLLTLALPALVAVPPARVPAAQEPAALHPAGAALILQVPDYQALLAAYETTAYGKILADPELHDALGQTMGMSEPLDPREFLLERFRATAEAEDVPPIDEIGTSIRSASLSLSVPGGDLAAFAQSVETADDQAHFLAENMTLRAVVDFVDAESATRFVDVVKDMLESEGTATEITSAGPVPGGAFGSTALQRMSLADPPDALAGTLRMVTGGSRVAVLMGAEADATALQRMAPSGAPDGSAATALAAGRTSFTGADGVIAFELKMAPLVEPLVLAQSPFALPALDVIEGLVGPYATMFLRGGHWRVRLVDGQFVTEGTHARAAESPLAGLLAAKALDPEDLALVRPDAILAGVVSLDPAILMRLYEAALEDAGERGQEDIAELEEQFGFNPGRDLIAPLGDAVAFSLPPLGAILSAPPLFVGVDVADVEALTRGLDGLASLIEAEAGDEVQLTREEYKGVRTYTLTFPNLGSGGDLGGLPINPATLFKPTIAIGQDRAFITTLRSHARREIRRVDKLKGELELHPTMTAGTLPTGATEVGFADWGQFVGKLYSGAKGLAPMLGMAAGELPFDPGALPDAEVIVRHIAPSSRWKRIVGDEVRVWGRSSFGPEAATAIFGAAVGSVFLQSTQSFPEPSESEWVEVGEATADAPGDSSLVAATQDTLRAVRYDVQRYQVDHGTLPSSLEALGAEVPTDAWGHALVYNTDGESFTLRSMGPNGVDDGGEGDDVGL